MTRSRDHFPKTNNTTTRRFGSVEPKENSKVCPNPRSRVNYVYTYVCLYVHTFRFYLFRDRTG